MSLTANGAHGASGQPAESAPQLLPVRARDGSGFELMQVEPARAATRWLYWIPAMGVPARHYLPLARALADAGVATVIHEWRGIGSSSLRASRRVDWGYRELLQDLTDALLALRVCRPDAFVCIGGHSLGGQLACLHAALHPSAFCGIALIASGSPYWRVYRHAWLTRLSFALARAAAVVVGYLPGRRIGFGGNEARGVIADWARSGGSGSYRASGAPYDLEQALQQLRLPVLALRLREDWMVPPAAMDHLLGKLSGCISQRFEIGRDAVCGQRADHFSWMKTPESLARDIAEWLNAMPGRPSTRPPVRS